MTATELAPTETDLALANGNPPRLLKYDPAAAEPDFLYEVIHDRIVRKTVGAKEIGISSALHEFLAPFVRFQGLGRGFHELGYDLPGGGPRRKPDVSFLSFGRWPQGRPFPPGDFVPVAPDLAVEVVSPRELAHVMFDKVEQYFRAGVSAVWLVVPHTQRVYCFSSPSEIRVFTRVDELPGDSMVPGFRLPLAELFPADPQPTSPAQP